MDGFSQRSVKTLNDLPFISGAAYFEMPVSQGRNHPLLVEDNDGHGLCLTINMPGKEAAPHDHGI